VRRTDANAGGGGPGSSAAALFSGTVGAARWLTVREKMSPNTDICNKPAAGNPVKETDRLQRDEIEGAHFAWATIANLIGSGDASMTWAKEGPLSKVHASRTGHLLPKDSERHGSFVTTHDTCIPDAKRLGQMVQRS